MAPYVREEHVLPRQGGLYAPLHVLLEGAQACLIAGLRQRVGRPLILRLLHDGTAATCTYAGTQRAAVIQLGTLLGIGFPPPYPLPIAVRQDLTVEEGIAL
jgi:hypothetical protein